MKKIIFFVALLFSFGAIAAPSQLTLPNPMVHAGTAPSAITTSTTSAQIFAQNYNRTGLECTNTGTVSVSLAFGANAAVSGQGTTIAAGMSWFMDSYNFSIQAINAISASAGTLSCTEYQ